MENCENDSSMIKIQNKQIIHSPAIVDKRTLNFPKKTFKQHSMDLDDIRGAIQTHFATLNVDSTLGGWGFKLLTLKMWQF